MLKVSPNEGNAQQLRNLVLAFLLVNLLIALWIANTLFTSHAAYERSAVNATQNMATAMDQSIAGSVDGIDLTLFSIKDYVEAQLLQHHRLNTAEVNRVFRRAQERLPNLYGIRASDSKGQVVFGVDVAPAAGASWADRAFFVELKGNANRGLVVTNPIFGKVTNKWILSFVRRYNYPDGTFAGVISASIQVDYFNELLKTLKVGPFGVALLRDSDLGLIARAPAIDAPSGQLGAKGFSPELSAAIASGEKTVTFNSKNTSDGIERTNTYRRLSKVPFHLVTGLGATDYLAPWKIEVRNNCILFVTFMLVTATGTWLLYLSNLKKGKLRQLMLSAINAAGEAFVMYDDEDRLVYFNEKYRELYSGTKDWIVPGAKFEDLVRAGTQRGIYKDAIGREEAFVADRLAAHCSGDAELITHLDDGRAIRVLDRKMPNGYTVGFRMDITDLVRATERAEQSARSKAQFLANMSHEIRTPMNAILGLLNLLQRTDLNAQQADYAKKTEHAAKSLLGLINDILDFSKVEAGKMTLECEPFEIDKLLRHLSVILCANVGKKKIEVLYDLDPDLPPLVMGDAMRLQQVLINLASNAVKFTSEGQVVVGVRKLAGNADEATIEFSVQDTGIGIASEHLVHIFSGFSQAEGSTTRRFGGTGLGLAISKRFVELMGGEIHVHSTQGVGSQFAFVLTMRTHVAEWPALAKPELSLSALHRVLVVDDNPVAGELTLHMVRSCGWSGDLASSAAQALEMISSQCDASATCLPYSVFCVDYQLSDGDGWEAIRRIREFASARQYAQPTVVMVAAQGREMLDHRTQDEHDMLNGFLVKPFTASMLRESIVEAFCGHSGLRVLHRITSNARPLNGMRILVVEDNLINQQVAEELLSASGASVYLAANGAAGVEAVAAAKPQFDVVLMDIQMPILDGYGATKAIRQTLSAAQLPIIAMTANAMASDRDACIAAGMNDHISKPFDVAKLVSLLIRTTGVQAPAEPLDASAANTHTEAPVLEVEGIDVQAALGRMSGLHALYARTARDFVKSLDTLIPELTDCIANGDQTGLLMRLHTLKGNAGTVGAMELARHAANLESVHKADGARLGDTQGLGPLSGLVASAQLKLRAVIARLEQAPPRSSGSVSDSPPRAEALRWLGKIAALAAASDVQALMCFAEARESLAVLSAEFSELLDQALQNLDFEAANALCQDRLSCLEPQLEAETR